MPEPLPRGRNPFDESGVERDADGRARYLGRPDSLVAMLAASLDRDPAATAVLEVGGAGAQASAAARRPRGARHPQGNRTSRIVATMRSTHSRIRSVRLLGSAARSGAGVGVSSQGTRHRSSAPQW